MRIVQVVNTLTYGGAELFVIRLVNALSEQYKVTLIILNSDLIESELLKKVNNKVNVLKIKVFPFNAGLWKLDSFLYKLNIDFSFRRKYFELHLNKIIKKLKPNVVHSHLFQVDLILSKVLKNYASINHVTTIHGDYLKYFKEIKDGGKIYQMHNYLNKLDKLLYNTKIQLAIISELQKEFFDKNFTNIQVSKIYNGYSVKLPIKKNKNDLGIPETNKVIGMVARGIKEKGWEIAINTFNKLKENNITLLLVGGSDYITELEVNNTNSNIIFLGNQSNPLEYIQLFDIGILPSYYGSESLPTTIIEYLLCNVPSVASDIGEIKYMLSNSIQESGVLLSPLNLEEDLFLKLTMLLNNETKLREMSENCQILFNQFSMSNCIGKYIGLYKNRAHGKQ